MKKTILLLLLYALNITYQAPAHVAAKSSHYNLINEMRKNPAHYAYSYNDLVDQIPETSQSPHETLIGFERRMEKELKKQQEVTEILDKKLLREREELVCSFNQAKQRLAKHIMKSEEELERISMEGEQKIKEFDINMKNQLQKQDGICMHLHKNMIQAKKQLALNIAQAEAEFLNSKRSCELQEIAEAAPNLKIQENTKITKQDENKLWQECKEIQNYLAQNHQHLLSKAELILKQYKNKRKIHDRNSFINTSLKSYIDQINQALVPLANISKVALEDPKAKVQIDSIYNQINPIFIKLNELFTYEASSLKKGRIKKVQCEPLNALYKYIRQPLQKVGSSVNAQKNLSSLDDVFVKLGVPTPQ